jgi:hypothetical protein
MAQDDALFIDISSMLHFVDTAFWYWYVSLMQRSFVELR